jgi:hypothetical protein
MKIHNHEILFKNHFKIYVLPKDKIIFESELEKQNVEYYCDTENQPMFENGIRYFIQDFDRKKLNKIFVENEIIAPASAELYSVPKLKVKKSRAQTRDSLFRFCNRVQNDKVLFQTR